MSDDDLMVELMGIVDLGKLAFFPAFADPASTIRELRRRWPEAEKDIVERANRIREGRFDLLAFRNLDFGNPVNWHLEPIAGKSAPFVHWSRLNYLDADRFGDKKIIWELNRHQYFLTLGQAYWLTADEDYAETFVAHIDSWMTRNPPKLGINWASSLEVAFRSISWIWALHFFKNSAALTRQTVLRIYKFLYLNARHLETYPSTYFSPNTHLTGEALGLFYLGTMLPEFKESARWRNMGLRILLSQLSRHVQSDGVYFEQSSYYHRYTADFYLHLWILLGSPTSDVQDSLRLLLDHLMYITRPDGTTPLFGDDDGGRLLKLDDRAANDFRSTLATGAALLGRSDYKFVSGGASQETLWLLGPAGLDRLDRIVAREPAQRSVAFTTGGYYVMRDGWEKDSNYLLFDCGPHGTDNCGHAHADALSFELAMKGQTMLVDPGTCTYTGSSEMRDWFRSTAAHNTLTIDGESSSVPAGPFSWKSIAGSACSSWISEPRFDFIEAAHDGFGRLPAPATHTRSILFIKDNYWVVRDRVESVGEHRIQLSFHYDSRSPSDILQIVALAKGGEWSKETGWVSHCYGEKEAAPVLSFSVPAQRGFAELVTFLLPAKTVAKEIEAIGGRAFEIQFGNKHDVLMLKNSPGRIETARLVSDHAITWARFDSKHSPKPEELILIDGRKGRVSGR
jgi:hypothetical protein